MKLWFLWQSVVFLQQRIPLHDLNRIVDHLVVVSEIKNFTDELLMHLKESLGFNKEKYN